MLTAEPDLVQDGSTADLVPQEPGTASAPVPIEAISVLSIHDAVTAYVKAYDPERLPRAALALEQRRVIAVINMLGTLRALNAARLASMGDRDLDEQTKRDLANLSGTTLKEAEQAIATGRALSSHPEVERAARSGLLSPQQLGVITEAAGSDSDTALRLAQLAPGRSLRELSEEAARMRAARTDAEQIRREIHAKRSLREWTAPDGTWHLRASGTPEAGAFIMAAINSCADTAFKQAREAGRHEPQEAYAFDGLLGLAKGGKRHGTDVFLTVHMDYDALLRGYVLEGEVCDIPGFGPTTPQLVMDLLETSDPFIKVILTRGKDVAGVAHLGRRPNQAQQTALDWVYPSCAAEGCGTRACWLQSDHREDWAKTHYTVFNLLDRLCPHHHRLKTYHGWGLVDGKGKRPFVPPEDPRHPGHRQGAEARAGSPPARGRVVLDAKPGEDRRENTSDLREVARKIVARERARARHREQKRQSAPDEKPRPRDRVGSGPEPEDGHYADATLPFTE